MPGLRILEADREKISPKFICAVCALVLVSPMQTPCGHLLCMACLQVLLSSNEKPVCPADGELLDKDKVFPDAFTERELMTLQLHCTNPGCDWFGSYKQLQGNHEVNCDYSMVACVHSSCNKEVKKSMLSHHLESECLYRVTKCEFCGTEMPFNVFKAHIENECPSAPLTCKHCGKSGILRSEFETHEARDCEEVKVVCEFKIVGCKHNKAGKRKGLRQHTAQAVVSHLLLLLKFVLDLWNKVGEMFTKLNDLTASVTEMEILKRNVVCLEEESRTSKRLLDSLQSTINELKGEKVSNLLGKGGAKKEDYKVPAKLQEKLDQISNNLEKVMQKNRTLEMRHNEDVSVINRLRNKLEQIDESLTLTTVKLSDMEANGYSGDGAPVSYNGTLLWKIDDFKRKRRAAVEGNQKAIYSPHFYSSQFGYKMCVRIYLNGDGFGKETHISLFFVVMKGEYDALLSWPFQKKITMMLLDQSTGDHMIDAFRSDPESSSFQRPTTKMNVASGSPLFMALDELPNRAYVKDDAVYIKVIVD